MSKSDTRCPLVIRVAFLFTERLCHTNRGECDEYFTGLVCSMEKSGLVFGFAQVIPVGNVACFPSSAGFLHAGQRHHEPTQQENGRFDAFSGLIWVYVW